MSKAVIHDSEIINTITNTLLNVQDDYIVGNPEWSNVTRSDVVLETKSSALDLPPIVVEIQNRVDKLFIKRLIDYSLQAFERYELDPTVLIICTNTLSDCVAKAVEEATDFPACYSFPSTGWASRWLIVSKPCVQECIDTMPLGPFVALGLFLASQAATINDMLCPDDPII
ncbi:hypothetical protein PS15p_202682 [Mucor circinelloides]